MWFIENKDHCIWQQEEQQEKSTFTEIVLDRNYNMRASKRDWMFRVQVLYVYIILFGYLYSVKYP